MNGERGGVATQYLLSAERGQGQAPSMQWKGRGVWRKQGTFSAALGSSTLKPTMR